MWGVGGGGACGGLLKGRGGLGFPTPNSHGSKRNSLEIPTYTSHTYIINLHITFRCPSPPSPILHAIMTGAQWPISKHYFTTKAIQLYYSNEEAAIQPLQRWPDKMAGKIENEIPQELEDISHRGEYRKE